MLLDLIYSDVAKKYKVDVGFINSRLKQLENSESSVYVHETLKTDDGVFTFNEEFSLLKELQR